MNSRGLKKKPATSPLKPNNNKKKSKSKSKQKEKSKKFSPQDFLEALIDLQNTRCSTNKKKRNTTRDISSALTVATPALEKTISASKIRSRSSFSQYRKKCNVGSKQPMTINLCAIITEEDNVQYTEKTARSSEQQQEKRNRIKLNNERDNNVKKLNENLCAIKIQRAWRNYQTFKILREIYLKQKRNKQNKKNNQLNNPVHNQLHVKIRKPDLQKTLRIKKQHAIKKQERKLQQFQQTKKIIEQRYKQKNNQQIEDMQDMQQKNKSPIQFFSQESQSLSNMILISSPNAQEQEIIRRMKQRQAQRFAQVINLIQKQVTSKSISKEELVNQLIQKFQNNKKILQKDLDGQSIKFQYSEKKSQILQFSLRQKYSSQIISPQFRPINKNVNNCQELQQNQQPLSIKSVKNSCQSQNSMDFDFEYSLDEKEELKIFDQRLKIIKDQKLRKLEQIDDILLQSRMTDMEALQKKQKIYTLYEKEKKQIQKNRKEYIFSLTKLKKCALKCQKSAIKQSSSLSKLRKSFSVGNTIIKNLIQDIKIDQFQLLSQEEPQLIQYIFRREQRPNFQESNQKPLTNTPILNLPSPNRNTQSQQQLLQKNNNTQVLKEYSEQIQQLIQKQLIQQFVLNTYMDENIFKYFKPYVEEVYDFKKVSDIQICNYLSNLRTYFPHEGIMLVKANQKVNPTSQQILRIIRDLQYEAEQYQLIIPQDCFKKYRSTIQYKYEQLNHTKKISFEQIKQKVKNQELALRIYKIEEEKNQKTKKYRNFQRDLKIMYMKGVFNCINQFLIELKSSNAFMNGRSSIGPGQLSLALKQYNQVYTLKDYYKLLDQAEKKIINTINIKCSIPCFKNYHDIQLFQRQVMKQIQVDSVQGQFRWVNYMDQILQIWQDLCTSIIQAILFEATIDVRKVFQ